MPSSQDAARAREREHLVTPSRAPGSSSPNARGTTAEHLPRLLAAGREASGPRAGGPWESPMKWWNQRRRSWRSSELRLRSQRGPDRGRARGLRSTSTPSSSSGLTRGLCRALLSSRPTPSAMAATGNACKEPGARGPCGRATRARCSSRRLPVIK